MDEKVYSMDDFKKEARKRAIKEKVTQATTWVGDKVKTGYEFCRDNAEEVAFVLAGVGVVARYVNKRKNISDERELKDEYCYDRSLGHYWRLKRKLSNREWLEIDNRKKNGERLSDILAEMRVLK